MYFIFCVLEFDSSVIHIPLLYHLFQLQIGSFSRAQSAIQHAVLIFVFFFFYPESNLQPNACQADARLNLSSFPKVLPKANGEVLGSQLLGNALICSK